MDIIIKYSVEEVVGADGYSERSIILPLDRIPYSKFLYRLGIKLIYMRLLPQRIVDHYFYERLGDNVAWPLNFNVWVEGENYGGFQADLCAKPVMFFNAPPGK